jgi:2-polyprenyl-3-methyl-5-hydroxy-6-metoxy-1,4-benzoquinol methylase
MNDHHNFQKLIQQQIAYYQERAGEYDEWFLRQGRYDRGEELNQQWRQEVMQVRRALDDFKPEGHVLELACGTGLWTEHLLKHAMRITAVDASSEAIQLNRQRLQSSRVTYVQADIFSWQPEDHYDVIFFSFWLSHVPSNLFIPFWNMVRQGLANGGRVFFIDSKYEQTSTAIDHTLASRQEETMKRRLNNGHEYQIVKIYYEIKDLEKRLGQAGWSVQVAETPRYFFFGQGTFSI